MSGVAIGHARLTACALALFITGCAQPVKPLYHWDGYQRQIYEHLKGEVQDPFAQLAQLQTFADRAKAAGNALPPGYRAHLALVQLRLGRDAEAAQWLAAEKASFPESTPYMDFLLSRMKPAKP
jgi:hypothetical protein